MREAALTLCALVAIGWGTQSSARAADTGAGSQGFEKQMARLGIAGEAADVSCSDLMTAQAAYNDYMASHPDDAQAKQVSGIEPNIPAVAIIARADEEAAGHFAQLNNVRTSNGLSSLSGGLIPLFLAVVAVCKDTSNNAIPHNIAFAAYVSFTSAAGDLAPLQALNGNSVSSSMTDQSVPPTDQAEPSSATVDTSLSTLRQGNVAHQKYATALLTAAQRGAIGDKVRACWTIDSGVGGVQELSVVLDVTTDRTGDVVRAQVANSDRSRVASDPALQAFAQRAERAVLDYRCSPLPLPPSLLGAPHSFIFRFSP